MEHSPSVSERVAAARESRWLDLEAQSITDEQLVGLQLSLNCPVRLPDPNLFFVVFLFNISAHSSVKYLSTLITTKTCIFRSSV